MLELNRWIVSCELVKYRALILWEHVWPILAFSLAAWVLIDIVWQPEKWRKMVFKRN